MTDREQREYAAWLASVEDALKHTPMPADTPERKDLWQLCRALPEQMEYRTFALDARWLDDLGCFFADRESKEADGESHASRIQ